MKPTKFNILLSIFASTVVFALFLYTRMNNLGTHGRLELTFQILTGLMLLASAGGSLLNTRSARYARVLHVIAALLFVVCLGLSYFLVGMELIWVVLLVALVPAALVLLEVRRELTTKKAS